MMNIQGFGNLCGNRALGQQVEVVKVSTFQILRIFKPVPGRIADTATGTVFKNNLWALMGQTDYIVQLPGGKKIVPIHHFGD